jgi:hypothetical protein
LGSGHTVVLILLVIGAILNISVFAKVIAVLWAPGSNLRNESQGACVLSAVVMGMAALLGGFVFQRAGGLLSAVVGAHEEGLIGNVWHFSMLTIVSLIIYTLGFVVYAAARSGRANAAETFDPLMESPVFGPSLRLAGEKKFDAYEIGVKVIEFITRIVFLYVERMIDVVGNGIIGIGRWLLRPVLSGAHNGIYGNYLGWTVAGFLLVLIFLFGSAV